MNKKKILEQIYTCLHNSKIYQVSIFTPNISKSLNIYKLNLIKKIKKNYEKKASEIYQSLSKKEKEKKQQYGCEEKILVEYRKKHYQMTANLFL